MHLNDRILAVDDSASNRMILQKLLGETYTVMCVENGVEALRVAPEFHPDLVLLDVVMPGLDGNQTCRLLHEQPELRDTKIVMVSARSELQSRLAAYEVGAMDYITKPFDHQEILAKVRAWLHMVYKEQVNDLLCDAAKTREVVGFALVTLTSFRDTETGAHLLRIRWYTQALAEQLAAAGPYSDQIDEGFLRHLYRASPLHDIGKVAIDDAILRKPGRLTAREFAVMSEHTTIGGDILMQSGTRLANPGYVKMAADIARHHHERFDGTGYPDKLAGLNIPLPARIVAVADAFDALTSDRVYRRSVSVDEAVKVITDCSGTQFDPVIVDALHARHADFRRAQAKFQRDITAATGSAETVATFDNLCRDRDAEHVEFGP
ncbi:MAG TPA: HD domain-containing phosphohydrolase [Pirellulales bacterium]|jgi:putative two-component system response regulator